MCNDLLSVQQGGGPAGGGDKAAQNQYKCGPDLRKPVLLLFTTLFSVNQHPAHVVILRSFACTTLGLYCGLSRWQWMAVQKDPGGSQGRGSPESATEAALARILELEKELDSKEVPLPLP